jgi:hypothetical protein
VPVAFAASELGSFAKVDEAVSPIDIAATQSAIKPLHHLREPRMLKLLILRLTASLRRRAVLGITARHNANENESERSEISDLF